LESKEDNPSKEICFPCPSLAVVSPEYPCWISNAKENVLTLGNIDFVINSGYIAPRIISGAFSG